MDSNRFIYLYEQYLHNQLAGDELQEWKAALANGGLNKQLEALVEQLWEREDLKSPTYDRQRAEVIYQEIVKSEGYTAAVWPVKKSKRIKLWVKLSLSAVAATIVIAFGTWLYYKPLQLVNPKSALANHIVPGKNAATLSLADGKVFILDTTKNSVVVADSITVETMLTASTPRGGTYAFTLPDGTKVWLNAASNLTFASTINSADTRTVELTGEAYFEVAHNKTKPFLVKTGAQTVQVLGTHFNVKAYPDETTTKTTLLEGLVRVSSKENQAVNLLPNQQALLSSTLHVVPIDAQDAVAWKNGFFMFDNETLESAMQPIARWYDVDVVFEDEASKAGVYFGKISRYDNISKVLNMLTKTDLVAFRIEGKTIHVTKNK
jgi:transmembrane sensor